MARQDADETDGVARGSRLAVSGMLVTRLNYDGWDLPQTPPNEETDAFDVVIQLADLRHQKLWRNGQLVFDGGHPRHSTAINDLRDIWQCRHLSPFDNLHFEIPFDYLRSFAEDAGRPQYTGLVCPGGRKDEVLHGLALALLPTLDKPDGATALFLDQIAMAVLAHLTRAYGGLHFPQDRKGTLAPWQERRATAFLAAHLDGQFSIGELAGECGLSRSYFTKAFKETFGNTPYRWLIEYRVAQAREQLLTRLPIAEVAVACGFTDQSHLTRVFCEIMGVTPGVWRKSNGRGVSR